MRLFRQLYNRGSSQQHVLDTNTNGCFKIKTGRPLSPISSDDDALVAIPSSNSCLIKIEDDKEAEVLRPTQSAKSIDSSEHSNHFHKPKFNAYANPMSINFGNEIIPYGGRPFDCSSNANEELRPRIGNREEDLDLVLSTGTGDTLFDYLSVDDNLYADIPAYKRLKDVKLRIMTYRRRNSDIQDRLRHLEKETKLNEGRISELRRENDRLIKENAVSMGKAMENHFLEIAIDSTKREVGDLNLLYASQEQQHLDTMRDCQNYKMKRRHLRSECQALEVISLANNYKVEKLTGQKGYLDAIWRERRIRLLMSDKLQVEEGRLLVYVRVRGDATSQTQKLVHLHLPTNDRIGLPIRMQSSGIKSAKQEVRYFRFNLVMEPSTAQEHVFEKMRHVVDTVVDERSACLLTYGATGTGKTHTLVGQGIMENRGLLVRAVEHLLRRIADHQFLEIQLSVSFLQIHAEKIACLLTKGRVRLTDNDRFVTINGQQQVVVKSSAAFCRLLENASRQRIRVETSDKTNQPKDKWMRSLDHMVVFMKLTYTNRLIKDKVERFFVACDLCSFTKTIDESPSQQPTPKSKVEYRDHDVRMNSRALMTLQQVIHAINSGSTSVPYRQSVLTRILRPCLNGGALCATLLTIVDDAEAEYSNLQTMQFGQLMMDTAMGHVHVKSKTSLLQSFYTF